MHVEVKLLLSQYLSYETHVAPAHESTTGTKANRCLVRPWNKRCEYCCALYVSFWTKAVTNACMAEHTTNSLRQAAGALA